jgi:epoxyqueuosine reductase QueG
VSARPKTALTKAEIVAEARRLGATLVGFAPVGRWAEHGDLSWEFDPQRLWPLTKTVIAMAIPSLLPITESTVPAIYRSQYTNTNQLLDEIAYRLSAFLNRHGHAAFNICRDGYGEGVMKIRPIAVFSHVWAGHYAGIGEVGWNHCLVTREFGPRHRLVSVLTALKLEGDPMVEENSLCNKCLLCQKACPTQAFSGNKHKDRRSNMNKFACFSRRDKFKIPQACGYCLKVCPVGEDRKLYQSMKVNHYFEERKAFFAANQISLDPVHPLNIEA